MTYQDAYNNLVNTMIAANCKMSEVQKMVLAGALAVILEKVANAEVEACAVICDVLAEDYGQAGLPMTYIGLKATSKEIRARKETK